MIKANLKFLKKATVFVLASGLCITSGKGASAYSVDTLLSDKESHYMIDKEKCFLNDLDSTSRLLSVENDGDYTMALI